MLLFGQLCSEKKSKKQTKIQVRNYNVETQLLRSNSHKSAQRISTAVMFLSQDLE